MRGGRKSERLREREIDWEREDRSGRRRQRPDQVGLGVEWSGLVVDGDQWGFEKWVYRTGSSEWWVRRSGGFDEWVRRTDGFVGVGLRNGFSRFQGWV